jgi:hypothetical protein
MRISMAPGASRREAPRWPALSVSLPVATRMTLTALPMTSAARFSPLVPRSLFQIFPQPISIGNMHTLAVFKDR